MTGSPATSAAARGRAPGQRSLDPLVPLVGVVAMVVYWLHGFDGYLSRDLGVYAYAGQRFADGVPPYVGILNRAGPLAHVVPGIGAAAGRLVGADELLAMRVLFLLLSVGCVVVGYTLGRDLFCSRWAGLATAATFLSFAGFIDYASGGPREKTPMVLFLLLALAAAVRRRWFLAGAWLSVATLVLQIVFFVGLPVLAVLALVQQRGRMTALLRIVAGGLVPVAAVVGYFAIAGALRDLVDGFLLLNARYTAGSSFATSLDRMAPNLWGAYGVTLWFFCAGIAALLLVSVAAFVPRARARHPFVVPTAAMGAGALVGLGWTLRDFDSWPDLFPLLPMGALGLGALFAVGARVLPRGGLVTVALAWTLAATAVAAYHSVGSRDDTLVTQRRSVAVALAGVGPGAEVLSLQAPQALVLSGKVNPTRHQMFTGGLLGHLDDTWPGGQAGFAEAIGRWAPDLVAAGRGQADGWADVLDERFAKVGCAPGWKWYANRSLGADRVKDLRAALRAIPAADPPYGCRGAAAGTSSTDAR